MARVELYHARAVGTGRPDLPVRVDRGILQSRDDDVPGPNGAGTGSTPRLPPECANAQSDCVREQSGYIRAAAVSASGQYERSRLSRIVPPKPSAKHSS